MTPLFSSRFAIKLALSTLVLVILSACGDETSTSSTADAGSPSSGPSSSAPSPTPDPGPDPDPEDPVEPTDTTPDAFNFANQVADTSAVVESNTITVQGINAPTPIVVGSASGSYSLNGAPYTRNQGTVSEGDSVRLQVVSSDLNSVAVEVTVSIGGIADDWVVTTRAADPAPAPDTQAPVITIDGGLVNGSIVNLTTGSGFTIPDASASDDVDGIVAVDQSNNVNTAAVGTYSVNYSAEDAAGNVANASLTVVVADPVAPPAPGGNVLNSVRQFTFNHSLWDHNFNTNAVTGYWIGEFAAASGTTYAWSGQFGQFDYHNLPPSPQLGSTNSDDVWTGGLSFSQLNLDNVLGMPPNFTWGGVSTVNPQEVTNALRVIDYVMANQPGVPFYMYEHWQEMSGYPLSDSQLLAYHNETRGVYHQWFLNYQNAIIAARPALDFRMIPVGPVIADVLTNPALQASNLAFLDLYEDNAPHGYPNLYFLAGLVTYQAMYGQQVSNSYSAPAQISSLIANDFPALNNYVWERLNFYNANGVRVWP